MPVELSCETCGDLFDVKPHRVDDAKYCSKDCQYEGQKKEFVGIECEICGEYFEVKPSRSESAKYCSPDCYHTARSQQMSKEDAPGWRGGRKIEISCEFCDSTFERYKSSVENQNAVRFCSNECKYNFMSDEFSEPGADIRVTSEYRTWRRRVKERDGECVQCGSTDQLHAHHITPVEEDEELATDIDNGVTLCADCHAKKHPENAELIKRKPYTDS